jgi:hypothetical protein
LVTTKLGRFYASRPACFKTNKPIEEFHPTENVKEGKIAERIK